jgi:hypothetical protein
VRSRRKLTILILFSFLSANRAIASQDVTTSEIKETTKADQSPPEGIHDMQIQTPPKVDVAKIKTSQQTVYFPYQSSVSPRLGFGTDTNRLREGNIYYYFYGLQYQLPNDQGIHWEATADVINDGTGVISVGRKLRLTPTEATRPYFKLAGAIHINPSEQLTTFLRSENFQLRPSAGFEYFLQHPSSVRVELETWFSLRYMGLHLSVGYAYAW